MHMPAPPPLWADPEEPEPDDAPFFTHEDYLAHSPLEAWNREALAAAARRRPAPSPLRPASPVGARPSPASPAPLPDDYDAHKDAAARFTRMLLPNLPTANPAVRTLAAAARRTRKHLRAYQAFLTHAHDPAAPQPAPVLAGLARPPPAPAHVSSLGWEEHAWYLEHLRRGPAREAEQRAWQDLHPRVRPRPRRYPRQYPCSRPRSRPRPRLGGGDASG